MNDGETIMHVRFTGHPHTYSYASSDVHAVWRWRARLFQTVPRGRHLLRAALRRGQAHTRKTRARPA